MPNVESPILVSFACICGNHSTFIVSSLLQHTCSIQHPYSIICSIVCVCLVERSHHHVWRRANSQLTYRFLSVWHSTNWARLTLLRKYVVTKTVRAKSTSKHDKQITTEPTIYAHDQCASMYIVHTRDSIVFLYIKKLHFHRRRFITENGRIR